MRAQAVGRTHALERQDATAEVVTGACNCVLCGRRPRGTEVPGAQTHEMCTCGSLVLLPELAAADGRVGDSLAGGSEAMAGGLVSSVRHVV